MSCGRGELAHLCTPYACRTWHLGKPTLEMGALRGIRWFIGGPFSPAARNTLTVSPPFAVISLSCLDSPLLGNLGDSRPVRPLDGHSHDDDALSNRDALCSVLVSFFMWMMTGIHSPRSISEPSLILLHQSCIRCCRTERDTHGLPWLTRTTNTGEPTERVIYLSMACHGMQQNYNNTGDSTERIIHPRACRDQMRRTALVR
jgi:hypothetical protein